MKRILIAALAALFACGGAGEVRPPEIAAREDGLLFDPSLALACYGFDEEYARLGGYATFGPQLSYFDWTSDWKGFRQTYAKGTIYYEIANGNGCTFGLFDETRDHYEALGGPTSWLGFPTSEQTAYTAAGEAGWAARFRAGATILQHGSGPGSAFFVHGAIRANWFGGTRDTVGFPTSDMLYNGDLGMYFNHFERGGIFWTGATGAHWTWGEIARVHDLFMVELGAPRTDVLISSDWRAFYSDFVSGSVYVLPPASGRMVMGPIRDGWSILGREKSSFGMPRESTRHVLDKYSQHFEGGLLAYTPTYGLRSIVGNLLAVYDSLGGAEMVGYPMGDQFVGTDGALQQRVDGALLCWSSGAGGFKGSSLTTCFGGGSSPPPPPSGGTSTKVLTAVPANPMYQGTIIYESVYPGLPCPTCHLKAVEVPAGTDVSTVYFLKSSSLGDSSCTTTNSVAVGAGSALSGSQIAAVFGSDAMPVHLKACADRTAAIDTGGGLAPLGLYLTYAY
jgi:hypothetical protein